MRIGLESQSGADRELARTVSPRLKQAAQEFEAQMMKELLKPMTGEDVLTGDDGEGMSSTGATGALGEFAAEALAQAISRHGGFGIAERIVHELSRPGTHSLAGKSAGPQAENSPTGTVR